MIEQVHKFHMYPSFYPANQMIALAPTMISAFQTLGWRKCQNRKSRGLYARCPLTLIYFVLWIWLLCLHVCLDAPLSWNSGHILVVSRHVVLGVESRASSRTVFYQLSHLSSLRKPSFKKECSQKATTLLHEFQWPELASRESGNYIVEITSFSPSSEFWKLNSDHQTWQ